eukprot:TRINITY_DN17758_c0_g1_i1.p1 TRINITY_DN17758_c0_g1~~TRINITY_DN17758_c0_g1_i1.p1  ORF type:complete len:612 (+),score=122.72 TRINITY_DN17758_c0_g1_i1:61-1896(+)
MQMVSSWLACDQNVGEYAGQGSAMSWFWRSVGYKSCLATETIDDACKLKDGRATKLIDASDVRRAQGGPKRAGLPVLLGSEARLFAQQKQQVPWSEGAAASFRVEDLLLFAPACFDPSDLGRLLLASSQLRAAVEEASAGLFEAARLHLLRSTSSSSRDGASSLVRQVEERLNERRSCELECRTKVRALRLLWEQEARRSKRWVAAENYTVGINERGAVVMWGRPGMVQPDFAERLAQRSRPSAAAAAGADSDAAAARRSEAVELEVRTDGSGPAARFVSVAGSRHAVFALTEMGQVMYLQVQRSDGRTIDAVKFLPLRDLEHVRVLDLSTRFGQAYAVAEDGSVYAWGMISGDRARPDLACSMGFGEMRTLVRPTPIPAFGPVGSGRLPVRAVVTGLCHALFLDYAGGVHALGRTSFGKLGLGTRVMEQSQLLEPERVQLPAVVVGAAAGAEHSLLLAADGAVFGCGDTRSGQLAVTRSRRHCAPLPRRLEGCPRRCISLAAGAAISFFVCEDGLVHFCGLSCWTSTPFGRSLRANPAVPSVIPGLARIRHATVSMELSQWQWEHAVFYNAAGRVYAWGHLGNGEFRLAQASCPKSEFSNVVVPVDACAT